MEGEFDRECGDYDCPTLGQQWDKMVEIIKTQTDPKEMKTRMQELEVCKHEIIEHYGDNCMNRIGCLFQKVGVKEKRAREAVHRHRKEEVGLLQKRAHVNKEKQLEANCRKWARITLAASVIKPKKKEKNQGGFEVKLSKKQEVEAETKKVRSPVIPTAPAAEKLYPDLLPLYDIIAGQKLKQLPVRKTGILMPVYRVKGGTLNLQKNEQAVREEGWFESSSASGKKKVCTESDPEQSDREGDKEDEREELDDEELDEEVGEEIVVNKEGYEGDETNERMFITVEGKFAIAEDKQGQMRGRKKSRGNSLPTRSSARLKNILQREGEKHDLSEVGTMFNLPLLAGPTGTVYQPWSLTDLETIVKKLPAITEGGGRWLNKLFALSHGQVLSVGDLRQIMSRVLSSHQMVELENMAHTRDVSHRVPLVTGGGQSPLCQAIRDKFPTPETMFENMKFKHRPGENGAAYINRCSQEWEDACDENPMSNPVTNRIFRAAVLHGAPAGVSKAMEQSPEVPGSDDAKWKRYAVHFIDRAVERAEKEGGELLRLQTELLKLQLEERKSAKNKSSKQMSQQQPAPTPTPPQPQAEPVHAAPVTHLNYAPQYSKQQQWNVGRGNRGRGRGFGVNGVDQCHRCGGMDHWASSCPLGNGVCFTCGETDHLARDCHQQQSRDQLSYQQPLCPEWDGLDYGYYA